ncbi:MAG: ATP-binding protein [Chloroflexi bacterium]|nr:ATP-binding protein [Chloroflexota bacterium]MCI0577870.1 ATP-binding protein [Chloroflexota bacterium]MCI0730238.1 ATP-binding protein [Chloroflexota bacterium]
MTTSQRFNLHLPGLLEVLAGSLYSTPKVGIRELIQNAHDSCVRRQIEGESRFYRPAITITSDEQRGVLTIRDNGHGLTADEIEEYLATIGRSYTAQLKSDLAIFSPDEAAELIGQFGFGFLSAFLLADEVTLVTRSLHAGPGEALRWHSSGGEYYQVEPATRHDVGTTVELRVKPSAAFVFDEELLVETIQLYADLLAVPIFVNDDPAPANLMTPPWNDPQPAQAIVNYIRRAFQESQPLCIVQLHDQEIDLGGDSLVVPLKGFLFVPPSSVASVREYGDLKVFIRRMFICERERKLLPRWARFVRGAIDCPYLQPTASRESIHEDDIFAAVRRALESQLGAALQRIADQEPETWRRIVWGHTDVITGWAVRDDAFFERVANIVTFRTSAGPMTLPEYLAQTGHTLYFLTRHIGALQEQLLAEGHDAPVIDAHWFAVKPFLEKYAAWHEGIGLVQMDGQVKHLLRPVAPAPFSRLLVYYQEQGIAAEVVAFKPADVPALMVYPSEVELIMETRQALDKDELPGELAGLVTDYLDSYADAEEVELQGRLYLNASCALIQQLAKAPPDQPVLEATLGLIYQVARLFSGRALTAADAALAFRQAVSALEVLISS